MKYKKLLSLLLLLIITNNTIAQNLNKTERTYFVLGTLNDYMGRRPDTRQEYLLDSYYANEGPLVNKIDAILRIDHPKSVYAVRQFINKDGKPYHFTIVSEMLSKKFNSFYNFVPESLHSSRLLGKLKNDLFKTDEEKLAFLAGVFVRFGKKNGNNFEFNITNSVSKAKICNELLIYFKSSPTYDIIKNIPKSHCITFDPSPQLSTYLKRFLPLQKKLHQLVVYKKGTVLNK